MQTSWFQANLVWWDAGETTFDLNKMIYSSKTWLYHNFKRTQTRWFEQSLVQNTLGKVLWRGFWGVKIVLTSHCHRKKWEPSRSHFATPMMVLYRKQANDLGTKWPNWSTNFARYHCEVIARNSSQFSNWKTPWTLCEHKLRRMVRRNVSWWNIDGNYAYAYP